MFEFSGKTAFVTGGASGIGLALGRAFAEAGMQVMLADIEADSLDRAVDDLARIGPDLRGVVCDVSDAASVDAAADATIAAFGKVHIVCNNAGVAGGSGIDDIRLDDWRWVMDVNAMGVLYGVRAFVTNMCNHGEGGHFVTTASLAGHVTGMGFSPYHASKFAAVAISEGLARELAPHNIGVSILCPGWVQTRISESNRNRQSRYGAPRTPAPGTNNAAITALVQEMLRNGLDPANVAARVLDAIRANDLYIFTHPEMHAEVEARFAAIRAAMDKAEKLSRR